MSGMNKEGWTSYDRWLGRLRPSTARTYEVRFNLFMNWLKENGGDFAGFTPDQLIEYQQKADNSNMYDLLDLLQDHVSGLDQRYKSTKTTYSVLKSFFMHNRAQLPADASFEIKSEIPPVKGDLTIENIRDMVLSCNEVYQAIFLSMFQGSLDLSCFDYWNRTGWESLKKQLKDDSETIRIDLPGRKRDRNVRPFYTLIGADAIAAIRKYISLRPQGGACIFYNKDGDPISKNAVRLYWLKHLKRLGLIKQKKGAKNRGRGNRYGKNPHEMRDVFRSQWEKSPAKVSVAEFMMGHFNKIDSDDYQKAWRDEAWVRSEYEKALPLLEIMSSSIPYNLVDADEVTKLRKRVAQLESERVDVKRELKEELAEVYAIIERLKEMEMIQTAVSETQHKVVKSEEEMIPLLNKGWTLIKQLNGDKYLLKK